MSPFQSVQHSLFYPQLFPQMMATDIISPDSYMKDPEPEQPKKPEEHIEYFIKNPAMMEVLHKKNIKYFFPIQYMTFETIYKRQDLIGRDRTGSGKTMAYSLPIIERFRHQELFKSNYIKFLIILPTRELCIQVTNEIESLKLHSKEYNVISLYGGVEIRKHLDLLRSKVDIVVATPGRLIDLLGREKVDFQGIEGVCLDEADQMLKMGFQQDVEKIYHHVNKVAYQKPQCLLFSATVPIWVERIAAKYMEKQRKMIDLIKDAEIKTSKTISHCSMNIKYKDIVPLMKDIVNVYCGRNGRCIIFCERKNQVNQIIQESNLQIESEALHSDISQPQRQVTFRKFKEGKLKCLISTNVAARGLDIPSVDLVIQLEPPKKVDDYIHRSGRTGRAGKKGVCLTIYLKNEEYLLRNIERVANIKFRDIGPPQQDDLLNRLTIDLIHHLKNIDENILDYFEWLASEMIYEMGSEKALARALAHITGVTKRIACTSVMNKQPGMITYKFKYAPSATKKVELQPEDLIRYLEDRLQTGEKKVANIAEIVKGTVKTVTAKCLAFEFPELYMKKMEPLQHENHSEYEIIRVSALSQLTSEQAQEDELPQYTQEQYDEAMYNNFEVYIGGLPDGADGYELQRAFNKKGIKFVNLEVKSKEGKKPFAFMKCLTEDDMQNAIALDGDITFGGKRLGIRRSDEKKERKRDDRSSHRGSRNGKY